MASETFGVKVNPDIKEKVFSMISASGLSSKEWFESVVSLYEFQKYKHHESAKKYSSDLEALQDHSSRINEIFSSLIKKVIDDNTYNSSEIARIALEKQNLIDDLEQQVNTLKGELSEVNRELLEIQKSWKQLDELSRSQKERILHVQSELERQNILGAKFNQVEFEHLSIELLGVKHTLELTTLRHEKEVQKLIAQHKQEIIEKYMNNRKSSVERKKDSPPKKVVQEEFSFTPTQKNLSVDSSKDLSNTKD